jgi:hypothetical protein
MADNVITITNDKSKATEHSANFSTIMCDHSDCYKFQTATHTNFKCWRQHPDLCLENRKSKFNIRNNNYLKKQRKNAKRNENSQNSKYENRAPKTYIKRARKFLKRRYEANHTGEPDYFLDKDTVINLAYFNYAKANKLKVKASKKIKKLIAGMDDNNSRKVNSSKIIKSADEDVDDNLVECSKCGKCGKWGYHTTEECKAKNSDGKSSRSDEANLASGGKGKTPAR